MRTAFEGRLRKALVVFLVVLLVLSPVGMAASVTGRDGGGGNPNSPDNPGNPDPGTPDDPGNPDPSPPDNPGQPDNPGNPNPDPGDPDPGQPDNPPDDPGPSPNPPDNPNNPPDMPPGDPDNPGQPDDPGQPDNPGNPNPGSPPDAPPGNTNPGQPDNPGPPEDPGNPDPGTPDDPGPPENPGNPNPGPPEDPGNPDHGPPDNPGRPDDPGNGNSKGHENRGGSGEGSGVSKGDRKALRGERLKSLKEKRANNNKSLDNLKDLLLEIPFTDESPYSLKLESFEKIRSLEGFGEDDHKLDGILDLMNQSLNESLWLDESHVLSSEVFKFDMHAAQKIRVLVDREKKSPQPLLLDDLTYALIKLVQADMMLAYVAVDEMEGLLDELPEEYFGQFEWHLQEALAQFGMAQTHVEAGMDVVAIQKFNNAWQHSYGFMLEKDQATAPIVTITSPADNSYTNAPKQLVSGGVFDILLSLIDNVTISVDGRTYSAVLQDGVFTGEVELTEGANLIEVFAVDFFGNTGSAQVTVILDTIPPGIEISGVADGAYYNRDVSALIEVSDANLAGTSFILDGQPYMSGTPITADGVHVVSVTATDKAGNSATKSVAFTVDKTPPTVSIAQPGQGAYVRQTVSIVGSAEDTNLDSVILKLDGEQVASSPQYEWDTHGYADGNHAITLTAVDKAGNSASVSVDVIVDNTPPRVTITSPDRFYVKQDVTVDAEVVEANLANVSVRVDGSEVAASLPYVLDTTPYPDGNHTIEVFAIDKAGNYDAKGVIVNVDNTAPEIVIVSPLDGSFVKHLMEVGGEVSDANLQYYNLSIDDIVVSSTLPYTWNTFEYAEGNHTVRLTAVDKAGNIAFREITVTVDNTLPRVEIRFPPDGAFVRGMVNVVVDVFDLFLGKFMILVDGVLVSENQSTFAWNTSAYGDGVHTIELVALDKSGNLNRALVNVTVDNAAPLVSITSPLNGSYVRQQVLVDASVVEANLETLNVKVDDASVSSSLPYAWDTSADTDGLHTVEVQARDRAGGEATAKTSVTVDNTPPLVRIIAPSNDSYVAGLVLVNFTIEEAYLHDYVVTVNDSILGYPITAIYPPSIEPAQWNTSLYEDGLYNVEVKAFDRANNTASDSVVVVVANRPPTLYVTEINLYPTLDNPTYAILGGTDGIAASVNGNSVPIANGSFTFSMNLTEGVNTITAISRSKAGIPVTWNKTILVDRDLLPDWYEVNVTGTDPLDVDSDSTRTPINEAGNDINDDSEDFDGDGLTSLQEFRLGTDPFSADTDGDGLEDSFEVFKAGTYPTAVDSDGDGVSDAGGDLDNDGLTNLQEQSLGTDPLSADTDGDSLSDGHEANTLKTSALSRDTDGDALDDDSEVKLGTNPLVGDSDGDGRPDGNETYKQAFVNASAGVEVVIDGVGDAGKTLFLGTTDKPGVLVTALPGLAKVVEVSTTSEVKSAYIKIYYDLDAVSDPLKLRMFYYNESDNSIRIVEVQGVDSTAHYVWGNTTHLSLFGIATPGDWFNAWYVDWQKPTQVFKAGEKMRVKANVRNIGAGSASNVKVEFREGSQTGTLIGTTTITSISAGGSALTSIEWTVKAGVSQICVNVDPDNLVAEVSEGNNKACKATSKVLDSDGDGLTDYEETNGMRVAFPSAFVKTDPSKWDTDGDGLSDGEEMGVVVYDAANKLTYDALRLIYGWPSYDGYHYEYKADPNNKDVDGDEIEDPEELELGLNPFVYSPYTLVEAGWGFLCGDFCADDPKHENIPFMGGWLVSGFLGFGDIRDLPSTVIKGDWLNFGLTVVALAPVIGDAESTLNKLVKMATKSDKTMFEVFEMTARSDKLKPLLVKLIDAVTGSKATKFIDEGAHVDDIVHIAKNRGNFKTIRFITKDDALKQTRWLDEGTSTWGWTHIKRPERWNQIIDKFGPKTELEIQEMIFKTIKEGEISKAIPGDQYKYTRKFLAKDGSLYEFSVAVSDKALDIEGIGKGNIITAFPGV